METNSHNYNEETIVLFLLGEAGSGKDTAGGILVNNYEFIRVSFADAVKDDVARMHKIDVQDLHRQGPIKEQYRGAMIGHAEAERAKDPLCWLKKAFEKYFNEDGHFKKGLKLVITDCRRDAEINWMYNAKTQIEEWNANQESSQHYLRPILFLIERKEKAKDPDVLTHYCIGYAKGINKASNIKLIDGTIQNSGTIEELSTKIRSVVETFELNDIYKETTK